MILDHYHIADKVARSRVNISREEVIALQSITQLLKQIDFTAEVVPLNDPERLIKLLISLKRDELNTTEVRLVREIVRNK